MTPDDVSVISRLIRAYSYVDTAKADALRERAFPEGSSEGVDVDELEESDWILYGDKYKQRKEAKEGIEKADTVSKRDCIEGIWRDYGDKCNYRRSLLVNYERERESARFFPRTLIPMSNLILRGNDNHY